MFIESKSKLDKKEWDELDKSKKFLKDRICDSADECWQKYGGSTINEWNFWK